MLSFLILDMLNVLNSEGSNVEDNAVINQFTNNLTLTCTTVDGFGEPVWTMSSQSGNAVVQQGNDASFMYSSISLINPTNDFAARFTCTSSSDKSLKKQVVVTRGLLCSYICM